MHRWMLAVACALSLLAPVALVQASGCAFALGFPPLHDLAPVQVGGCGDDEGQHPDRSNGIQQMPNGWADWQSLTNRQLAHTVWRGERTFVARPREFTRQAERCELR